MKPEHAAKLAALFGKTTTDTLITSLLAIDQTVKTKPTPELRLTRAWTIDELERRYPAAKDAVLKAFEDDEERIEAGATPTDIDDVAILLDAIASARKA